MRELFPWWDYSNFYKLMGLWMSDASNNFYDNNQPEAIPNDLTKGAELCDLISKEFHDNGDIISTEEKIKYIEQLGTLLRDNSLSWWD